MRFIFIVVCIIAIVLRLTTALPHYDRVRRGPVDLSGLTGNGGMSSICIFQPCSVQPIVLPATIDWDAVFASIAQWNQEQEELSSSKTDD
jgi:hypothetical protein